jgi:L-malate glycosyltransferase
MTTVHQFVPYLLPRDAVGGHVLEIQRLCHEQGWRSEIFAGEAHAPLEDRAHAHTDYGTKVAAHDDDVLVFHSAIGSPMAQWLVGQNRGVLVVDYHNVTPHSFFAGWNPQLVADTARGRRQLNYLASRAPFAIADSAYNESELIDAGYPRTAVVPILLDLDYLEAAFDDRLLRTLEASKRDGGARWLFVGRIAPNKCQHDIVQAFLAYRRVYDPKARLHLVSGPSPQSYFDAVEAYVHRLGLSDAVELTGSLPPDKIAAHYRAADVFVCLSEHEGFCVPIIEAWHHRLPIVAFDATAVPETLGDGGLLLHAKDPMRVATAVHRVLTDSGLRDGLVERGTRRLAAYSLDAARLRFLEAMHEFGLAS